MSDLEEVFPKLVLKRERTVKSICKPLEECLEIPIFAYGRVESDGCYVNFSNSPKEQQVYYNHKLYHADPYLIHPHLLRSGSLFIPSAYNPDYMQQIFKEAEIGNMVVILERSEDFVE